MRALIITKIFPNGLEPTSAPFNRQQFSRLAKLCGVEILATIPWFPGAGAARAWSPAGRLTAVPASEMIDGLSVRHPRTLFVPRFAPGLSGPLYAASLLRHALTYRGKVSVVLGSWAYPDGYAAIQLAKLLGVPAVVKLHGSDINVVAQMTGPRKRLRGALPSAARIVAVSRPLADAAIALGVSPDRIDVVPNGIDRTLFFPAPREAARAELGVSADRRVILYVGRLEREKGVLDLLAAVERMPSDLRVELVLLGNGSARPECEARAAASGGRVRILGARPLKEVPRWLAAANVSCLPSWNEGMPNVVLEALASGRRVVGTRVGAIPELLADARLGELVPKRAPAELSEALLRAATAPYDPDEVARIAGVQSWEESARSLYFSLLRATGQLSGERVPERAGAFEVAA